MARALLAAAAAVGVRLPCVVRWAPAPFPSSSSAALPLPRRGRAVVRRGVSEEASGGSSPSRAEASDASSALAFAVRRLVLVVVVAEAASTSACGPRLAPRRVLFAGSGSGSGSGAGAVVAGAFVPRAVVLRVGLLASAGSWSVDPADFVVVRERRTGSSPDAAGFGCAASSGFLALLTDLAGARAVS